MSYLKINQEQQSFLEVKEGKRPLSHPAWQFCHDWLNGQELFEQQTSGSTGKPKNIQAQRKQMEASAKATIQIIGLQANDNLLVCLNTAYIGGKMMLVRGMEGKMNLHIYEASGNPLAKIDEVTHFHFTALVPLQIQQIMEQSPEKLPLLNAMRGIIIGGAPVSLELQAQIQKIQCPVYSTYGMTETVSHIALRRLNPPSEAYQILPNTKISQDERGCLIIKSPVTLGQEIITSDLIEITSERSFKWLGRADFTINSGGIKIQPEQLEEKIAKIFIELEIQQEFAIIPQEDKTLGQKVLLAVEGKSFKLDVLKNRLSEKLSKYEVPKQVLFFPTFPRTPNGKINRRDLIARINR